MSQQPIVIPSLPLAEHVVEVEGLPIYYRTGGSGPPLLLLHGATVIGRAWDPFLDALGEHYTVVVPDLPGHGRSPTFPPDGWPATGRIMLGLADALGVQRLSVVGHSAGAFFALQMADQDPQRMESIVLMGAAHLSPLEANRAVADWTWENRPPEVQERLLARHPGGVPQIRAILARLREGVAPYMDRDMVLVPAERLKSMATRVLLVVGDRDRNLPLEVALEAYRALPHAALWVIPGGGHGAIWDLASAKAMFPAIVHDFMEGKLVQ